MIGRLQFGMVASGLAACLLVAALYLTVPRAGGPDVLQHVRISAVDAALEPNAPAAGSSLATGTVVPRFKSAIDAEWERRAVPAATDDKRFLVAVVLDDVGLDRARAQRAIALPAPLTLAFMPYGRDAPALAVIARQRGHEVLLHMPMQPVGNQDPGPQALTVDLAPAEIRARVGAALDRFGDAVGLNNHMGSRFTAERRLLVPVAEELAARGLFLVDSRTTPNAQGAHAAEEVGIPSALRDVFLDNEAKPEAIRARLVELERIARARGHAVAIGHPYDATLAVLAAWLPGLGERGFQAVPISTVVRRNVARGAATR
jgi:hypothetical protein